MSVSNFKTMSNLNINQCKVIIQNYYDKIYNFKTLSADEFLNIPSDDIDSRLHSLHAGIEEIKANKTDLKLRLAKRKQKRLKIRRTKDKIRTNLKNIRIELNKKIDSNLEHLADESEVLNQEKKSIKHTQWKIKLLEKKLEDSINKQSVINGLITLRKLRENQNKTYDGEIIEESYNHLSGVLNQLKTHISNLETAKELLEKSNIYPAKEHRYTPNLCNKLFGDYNFQPNPLDRMSVDELFAARKYWDQYFVNDCDPDGSHIPNYWVGQSSESD